jgi:hypothetical protein
MSDQRARMLGTHAKEEAALLKRMEREARMRSDLA